MPNSSTLPRTIAVVRVAASVFFPLLGEYRVTGLSFARGGFQPCLQDYIANACRAFPSSCRGRADSSPRHLFRMPRRGGRTPGRNFSFRRAVRTPRLHSRHSPFAEDAAGHLPGTGPRSSGLALFRRRAGSSSPLAAADHSVRGRCGTGLGAGPAPRMDFLAGAVKS